MQKNITLALVRRFVSTQKQNTKERIRGVKKILGAGMLTLVILGIGNMAHAGSKVLGRENISGIGVHPGLTTLNTNVDLCGWGWGTTLRVDAKQPHHNRVFALWNLALVNDYGMFIWFTCSPKKDYADVTMVTLGN